MYKALTLIPAWVKEDHFPSCFPLISSKLRPFVCCKPAPNTVTPPSVDPCAALLLLLPGACWAETVSELHPSLNCILISSLAIISSLFGIFFLRVTGKHTFSQISWRSALYLSATFCFCFYCFSQLHALHCVFLSGESFVRSWVCPQAGHVSALTHSTLVHTDFSFRSLLVVIYSRQHLSSSVF